MVASIWVPSQVLAPPAAGALTKSNISAVWPVVLIWKWVKVMVCVGGGTASAGTICELTVTGSVERLVTDISCASAVSSTSSSFVTPMSGSAKGNTPAGKNTGLKVVSTATVTGALHRLLAVSPNL